MTDPSLSWWTQSDKDMFSTALKAATLMVVLTGHCQPPEATMVKAEQSRAEQKRRKHSLTK